MKPTNVCAAAVITGLVLAGCASAQRQSAVYGSTHTHRSQLSHEKAARCFARNAEERSSALASEVTPAGDTTNVIVRVKNGVTYATADYRRSGSGSIGSIQLMVTTSRRDNELYDFLVEGC